MWSCPALHRQPPDFLAWSLPRRKLWVNRIGINWTLFDPNRYTAIAQRSRPAVLMLMVDLMGKIREYFVPKQPSVI